MSQTTDTDRQVFDKVRNHLLTQKQKSERGPGQSCGYRGKNGLQCAVGCLITDEAYNPEIEGEPISQELAQRCLIDSGITFTSKTEAMLLHLQYIHDFEDVSKWEGMLNKAKVKFFPCTESD